MWDKEQQRLKGKDAVKKVKTTIFQRDGSMAPPINGARNSEDIIYIKFKDCLLYWPPDDY